MSPLFGKGKDKKTAAEKPAAKKGAAKKGKAGSPAPAETASNAAADQKLTKLVKKNFASSHADRILAAFKQGLKDEPNKPQEKLMVGIIRAQVNARAADNFKSQL